LDTNNLQKLEKESFHPTKIVMMKKLEERNSGRKREVEEKEIHTLMNISMKYRLRKDLTRVFCLREYSESTKTTEKEHLYQ